MVIDEAILLTDLQKLGLTQYESQALIALTKLGTAEASRIAKVSNVPQSKIYETMRQLERKGIITTEEMKGSANYYRFLLEPSQAILQLRENYIRPIKLASERVQGDLTKIYGTMRDKAHLQHELWTIKGIDRIIRTIEEMMESAQSLVFHNFTHEYFIAAAPAMKAAKERGVEVRAMMRSADLEEIRKSLVPESIIDELMAGDFDKLREELMQVGPFLAGGSMFPFIVDNFQTIIENRPNILIVDPNDDVRKSLIVVRSKDENIGAVGVEFINKDFIDFQMTFLGFIWGLIAYFGKSMSNVA
ncbi:MAG: TrmB family transcriptional regulator [Candidatus Hodarchaeales archaeon]|jgi:sugar-specific transcriptional regulator TrmB